MRAYSNWQLHLDSIFCEDQGWDALLMADCWSRRWSSGRVCEYASRSQGRSEIHKKIFEAQWPALNYSNGQTAFLPRRDNNHWKYWSARNGSLVKLQSWEFSFTVHATKLRDAKISQSENRTKTRLSTCFNLELFQSGTQSLFSSWFSIGFRCYFTLPMKFSWKSLLTITNSP